MQMLSLNDIISLNEGITMPSLIVRDIDTHLKMQFQALAREEGLSMEEKIRRMIAAEVSSHEEGLGTRIARMFRDCQDEDYTDFLEYLEEIRHSANQIDRPNPFEDVDKDSFGKSAS